ncbi:hypothetical protein NP493_1196g00053 [Ridgeia piscesae]|uniref:EGF-like domain-containing protein n=1 Tax=Ridgeia piscesae TaxID=27915 RepID=A0AAD9NGK7_RIDPI|nr:hypothetical protein NP493_1196g00053 [Ridgeia piscesae]
MWSSGYCFIYYNKPTLHPSTSYTVFMKTAIASSDECAENPCLYGGTCTDKENDFSCACPDGFAGKKCEMRPTPGSLCSLDPCGGKGVCLEDYTTSKARCICQPGYTSGRYKTLWLDTSDPDATGDDETLATLKQKVSVCGGTTPVGVKCRVKGSATTFSEGDSTSQVLQVACSTAGLLCLNANQTTNTTCHDYQIQFTCDAGGSQCVNVDTCAEEKCQNGATCSDNSDKDGVYQCHCASGFTGYNCQHNVDECASNPCHNGATCNDMVNGYNCSCRHGYAG